jgi:hypothetical protein
MVQWNDPSGYPGRAPSILHHNCGIKTASGQSSVKLLRPSNTPLPYYCPNETMPQIGKVRYGVLRRERDTRVFAAAESKRARAPIDWLGWSGFLK